MAFYQLSSGCQFSSESETCFPESVILLSVVIRKSQLALSVMIAVCDGQREVIRREHQVTCNLHIIN